MESEIEVFDKFAEARYQLPTLCDGCNNPLSLIKTRNNGEDVLDDGRWILGCISNPFCETKQVIHGPDLVKVIMKFIELREAAGVEV